MKRVRVKIMLDRKDGLDVSLLTGQREERLDKSSSKVTQDLSVFSSDFEVISDNFQAIVKGVKNEREDKRGAQ